MENNNCIFLEGPLTKVNGEMIIRRLYECSEKSDEDIVLYINSPGGSVNYCFAIVRAMEMIKNDVFTIVVGQASSAAAVILAAGTEGKRIATKNSQVMLHMPRGQVNTLDDASLDMMAAAKRHLENIVSTRTGMSVEEFRDLIRLELFIEADEAEKMNVIDQVM